MALKISVLRFSTLTVCPVTSSLYFAKSTDALKLESLLLVSNKLSPSSDNSYSGIRFVKSSLIVFLAEVIEDSNSPKISVFIALSFTAAASKIVEDNSGMLIILLISSRSSFLILSMSIVSTLLDSLDSLVPIGLLL